MVGGFRHEMYEPSFCAALRRSGAEVSELNVTPFFGPGPLIRRAQEKYAFGPGPLAANAAVVAASRRIRPDIVLLWRTHWLAPIAIRALRNHVRHIALYNNDDPFGPDRDAPFWRRFRRLIPHADICFAYRPVNLEEYRQAGAPHVALLRSYFVPAIHFPPQLSDRDRERYRSDVVFAGHCEPDIRLEAMDRLLESELHVRIFGSEWEQFAAGHRWEGLLPIPRLREDQYRIALGAAKIAMVFLSSRNRDEYTRRCFEIPAVGSFMLAPRTAELQGLFTEGEEAAFFSTVDELIATARHYAEDDAARLRIAAAGRERVWADGHDVDSRAREFMRVVLSLPPRLSA